jgi:uncharacterized protein (UPF0305 family)
VWAQKPRRKYLLSEYETIHPQYGGEACVRILETCRRLALARTKGELGTLIAEETLKFSVFDLQVICGRIHHEISRLPSPYREAVRPYFLQQLFESHHQILLMHRSGSFLRMETPLHDPALFQDYLRMVSSACFSRKLESDYAPNLGSPVQTFFYFLMAAFSMFVLDRPGHPVGMPFPGGFWVEERGGQFYCPVRDKEKEVPFSICNFCPSLQSPNTDRKFDGYSVRFRTY